MAKIAMLALMTVTRTIEPGKPAKGDKRGVPPKTEDIDKGRTFEADDEDEANELENMGAAVRADATDAVSKRKAKSTKPSAVKQETNDAPKALEGDARMAKAKEIVSGLTPEGFGADGKPKVQAINDHMPKGTKAINGKERDAIWTEVSDANEGDGTKDLV